jgi:hypothetical protein
MASLKDGSFLCDEEYLRGCELKVLPGASHQASQLTGMVLRRSPGIRPAQRMVP